MAHTCTCTPARRLGVLEADTQFRPSIEYEYMAVRGCDALRRPRQKSRGRQRPHSSLEDTWLTCHRQFVKELDEWDKQGGWDVLFYGDSIVEEWRCAPATLQCLCMQPWDGLLCCSSRSSAEVEAARCTAHNSATLPPILLSKCARFGEGAPVRKACRGSQHGHSHWHGKVWVTMVDIGWLMPWVPCRGTFLGAPWGPFHDVRKVWDEFFGRKPYRAHSMGIASKTPLLMYLERFPST